jgi:hypothetical protein
MSFEKGENIMFTENINEFEFIHKTNGYEVRVKTEAAMVDDIIEEFAAFLRGCQFAECSIRDGFRFAGSNGDLDNE